VAEWFKAPVLKFAKGNIPPYFQVLACLKTKDNRGHSIPLMLRCPIQYQAVG
jgi:hypothetical protein